MRNRQIKKNLMMLIALMGALLVSISLSVRAGEGDGKTVSVRNFSQLKAALEDPDTETVCLEPNTIGLEYSESLVTSRAGDHGITVNGTKILDIGKGGHHFYFKESEADKNGFDAFFYVGSHASLTITGEGGLEYSPAFRTDTAENSMFLIGTGGKVNISDDFKGMLAVTAGKNKKTDVCSLFTLEKIRS
ncbi:MAG: hypothetical protein K5686_04035 [Lachnospiraceae bacterium]|nr:hypothetical protein [Lachnospiraceae bacterium]